MKGEFWHPAQSDLPDLTIAISGDAIFEATPCFLSGLAFASQGGQAVYSNEFTSMRTDAPDCAPSLPAFDTLNTALRTTAAARQTGTKLVLLRADGSAIAALELQRPDGIEFRRLTVTAFRHKGKLWHAKPFSRVVPYIVLYSGQIEGSVGCGGVGGSRYSKSSPSSFRFHVTSILAGSCENADRALEQVDRIVDAFNGARAAEERGADFTLRDDAGNIQIVLSPYAAGGAK